MSKIVQLLLTEWQHWKFLYCFLSVNTGCCKSEASSQSRCVCLPVDIRPVSSSMQSNRAVMNIDVSLLIDHRHRGVTGSWGCFDSWWGSGGCLTVLWLEWTLCLCFDFVAEQQLVESTEVGPIPQEARHQFTDLRSVSSCLLKVRFDIRVDRVLSSLEPLSDITSSFSQ